jgi:hypothetical protein
LADYLEHQPDALLRGRRPQKMPQGATPLSSGAKP